MSIELQQYIKEIKKYEGSDLYIYGAGKVAKIIYKVCTENGIKIKGFLVSNKEYNMDRLFGLPVNQYDAMLQERQISVILMGFLERGSGQRIKDTISKEGWQAIIDVPDDVLQYESSEMDKRRRPVVEVTVKIGCKVNCKYCPQKLLLKKYYVQDVKRENRLSFDEYKRCLQKLPKNTLIEFAGFAEPFLNEECIDMMKYTHEQGYEMTLFTTLVGLDKGGFEQIKHIPFKQVVLHVADNKDYADIKVTEEYLDLLEYMVLTKRSDGMPFVSGANCQAEPHPEVVSRLSGKIKIYCELTDRAGNIDEGQEVLAHARKHGNIRCSRSVNLDHNILLPDGTLVLCCNDFGLEHPLGNLLLEDYNAIINGEKMNHIKNMLRDETSGNVICRKCVCAQEIRENKR